MLFPSFFPLKADEPKWTGEVKAFAYYPTPECLPQERIGTVYAARKTFEDGSTVTLVRTVPTDSPSTFRLNTQGEGRIERDRSGAATLITIAAQDRHGATGGLNAKFDPVKGTLATSGWDGGGSAKGFSLPDRKAYVLDPVEALAFGVPASAAGTWLTPVGTYGYLSGNGSAIGLRYGFSNYGGFAFELAGRREMFRRVDVTRNWIGSSIALVPEYAGSLLFHADGGLAAYVPLPGVEALPGKTTWDIVAGEGRGFRPTEPPPFALRGKLGQIWNQGTDARLTSGMALSALLGVLVPTEVSASERASVLDSLAPPPAEDSSRESQVERDSQRLSVSPS